MTGGRRKTKMPKRTEERTRPRLTMVQRLTSMRDRYTKDSWIYKRLTWIMGMMNK